MKRLAVLFAALCCIWFVNIYADECTPISATYLTSGIDDMSTDGDSYIWDWDGSYNCAVASRSGAHVGYLITPALNMTGAQSVSLMFEHTHKFAGVPAEELTLWVTDDYQGSYDASSWEQLIISTYATNNDWKFVSATINVPVASVGANTAFAFKYMSTASDNAKWEIKNLNIISECPGGGGLVPPVDLPNVGDGRLKIFAQNVQNYYYHYDNYESTRANYDEAAFIAKTRKMINAMLMVNADIFALCEVEAQPIVLAQLADSMNARVEGSPYTAVSDGIDVAWDSYDNNIKSGFIYRNDKVKPYGQNYPASSWEYYQNTMRIQAFEELATGERFTLAMNHFKAKTGDGGAETRINNANHLVSALNSYKVQDPDILILGDLNCEIGEDPITIIQNAGYEEQLVKYDENAYSHCYSGGELIDHAFANPSMAAMVTGAGIFHISTSCGDAASHNIGYRYSDHDPYVIAINLPEPSDECQDMDATYLTSGLGDFTTDDASVWSWSSSYNCAMGKKQGGYEGNLFSPELNLGDKKDITINFSHAHNFVGTPSEDLTLWVTNDYKGSYGASTWQQLTIDPYTDNNSWTWKDVTIDVPKAYVGAKTVFAFHYKSTASAYGTWEIKNLHITATCDSTTAIDNTEVTAPKAFKYIENGHIYIILPDGSTYNVMGQKIQ